MAEDKGHEARIFNVDSRFVQMARRPGGVPRDHAMVKAQSHVEELSTDFTEWLEQELQQLRATVAEFETNPSDMTAVDRAETICSQLRDIGATVGYELVTFVAGSLCVILDTVKAGATYDKDMIDCHMNALFLVRTEPYRNLSPHQVPEMSSGLRRVVELAVGTQSEPPAIEANQTGGKNKAADGSTGSR